VGISKTPLFPYTTLFRSDSDVVDISNLHRQHYFEKNIGEKKANVLAEHLKEINNNIEIKTIHCLLNYGFFKLNSLDDDIDLIIRSEEHTSDLQSRDKLVC